MESAKKRREQARYAQNKRFVEVAAQVGAFKESHYKGSLQFTQPARCQRCGAKVDTLEGVVAKQETAGSLARLWHVECWNKDDPGETGYGYRW